MAGTCSIQKTLSDDAATTALGQALAPLLNAGDVVLLDGDLGAGKTHLARAIIQARLKAAGAPVEDVPSPTFTLIQTYQVGPDEIWHSDLYRLSGPEEIVELGLDNAFETSIVLVEWPDRLDYLTPKRALRITLVATPEDNRNVTLSGPADWADRLSGLADK